jgi:uncharacterized protein with NRDE domain
MCLVVLAYDSHPQHALILAANRDEFHSRPTQDAHWWHDEPAILGGRDLLAGGSWLALHRNGRFAAVTNDRDADSRHDAPRSRGELVTGFLRSGLPALEFLQGIDGRDYAGFNLLVGARDELAYLSNRGDGPRVLPAGIYGLSNATLDTPWHKVERSKSQLTRLIAEDCIDDTQLLRLLSSRDRAPAGDVDNGRLPFATAHAITAPFIVLPEYGTRCSTIVRADRSGCWQFLERRFDPAGGCTGESRFSFSSGED